MGDMVLGRRADKDVANVTVVGYTMPSNDRDETCMMIIWRILQDVYMFDYTQ